MLISPVRPRPLTYRPAPTPGPAPAPVGGDTWEPTSPLPTGKEHPHFHGRRPVLDARTTRAIASAEKSRRDLFIAMLKADPQVQSAITSWPTLSIQAKLDAARRIAALQGQAYHFTPAPMRYDAKAGPKDDGAYDDDTRRIDIGKYTFRAATPRDLFDTVIHEQLHAYQHQKYIQLLRGQLPPGSPIAAEARVWLHSNDHYIDADANYDGYRKQPIESFAWDSAALIMTALLGPEAPAPQKKHAHPH